MWTLFLSFGKEPYDDKYPFPTHSALEGYRWLPRDGPPGQRACRMGRDRVPARRLHRLGGPGAGLLGPLP